MLAEPRFNLCRLPLLRAGLRRTLSSCSKDVSLSLTVLTPGDRRPGQTCQPQVPRPRLRGAAPRFPDGAHPARSVLGTKKSRVQKLESCPAPSARRTLRPQDSGSLAPAPTPTRTPTGSPSVPCFCTRPAPAGLSENGSLLPALPQAGAEPRPRPSQGHLGPRAFHSGAPERGGYCRAPPAGPFLPPPSPRPSLPAPLPRGVRAPGSAVPARGERPAPKPGGREGGQRELPRRGRGGNPPGDPSRACEGARRDPGAHTRPLPTASSHLRDRGQ